MGGTNKNIYKNNNYIVYKDRNSIHIDTPIYTYSDSVMMIDNESTLDSTSSLHQNHSFRTENIVSVHDNILGM